MVDLKESFLSRNNDAFDGIEDGLVPLFDVVDDVAVCLVQRMDPLRAHAIEFLYLLLEFGEPLLVGYQEDIDIAGVGRLKDGAEKDNEVGISDVSQFTNPSFYVGIRVQSLPGQEQSCIAVSVGVPGREPVDDCVADFP